MRLFLPQPLRPLLLVVVLLLSAGSRLYAQAPTWQDATSPGRGGGSSTAVDAVGNTYVTGGFTGTATFGATTLTSAGGDVFVAKRTPAGVWQWATCVASGQAVSTGVAVDGSGSVVVTGSFTSPTITFGATTLTNAGAADIFVAKLTPTGAWQWATSAEGIYADNGFGVAMDGSGSVVVTGCFFSPTITFGATTLTSVDVGDYDIFVAKLTPTGVWQWATHAGGVGNDTGYGLAVDSSGSVVITGSFTSRTITFGATTLTNTAVDELFVAKLAPTGAWQWATGVGGSGGSVGFGVAVNGSGSVVVTGGFRSPAITFGATTLTSAAVSNDIFVAQLTPTGAWQWATGVGGIYFDVSRSVAVDGSGSVVITGRFSSPTIAFGATTLTNAGGGGLTSSWRSSRRRVPGSGPPAWGAVGMTLALG